MFLALNPWMIVKDGDQSAFKLVARHYSHRPYRDGRRQNGKYRQRHLFVGPGEKIVLLSPDEQAVFVWRRSFFWDGKKTIHCSIFRNESRALSSHLILAAEIFAIQRWGSCDVFTFVNPKKVTSTNPGYCFIRAGWVRDGKTKGGLLRFRKRLENS